MHRNGDEIPPAVFTLARAIASRLQARLTERPSQYDLDYEIAFLARGGYNDVWTVKVAGQQSPALKFVLRLPHEDSLRPYQIMNEVGWLSYVARHCPEVPVPEVYEYSTGMDGTTAFIAMEFVDGEPLIEAWKSYSEADKAAVARKLAELIIHLGELRFDAIGGIMPSEALGPTVEGVKLFKGRDKYHDSACYNIGPYLSIRDYILAYYDKEIHYYSHADSDVLDEDLFEEITPADFVHQLKSRRSAAEAELDTKPRDEPFVLRHCDLQGRNILMRDTEILSVIDWEFAASLPLSELFSDGLEVIEQEDEAAEEECFKWDKEINNLVGIVARERSWSPRDVELLLGDGDRLLQGARVEMIPSS